ncbi:hypothetical protein JCM6882_001902, partial [Rhodosporidiobolus microsporus]
NPETRAEIASLLSTPSGVADLTTRFSSRIAFGTAGLRGPMQAGPSAMNDLVIIQASQGLAKYAEQTTEGAKERGIVVGHDHRHHSGEFARLTAGAFRRRGWKVYELDGLVHTPLVPFATKRLKAALGVMITASHNPAKDNGYKVYWSNAVQIIPPHDSGIASCILDSLEVDEEAWSAPKPKEGEAGYWDAKKGTEELVELYMEMCAGLAMNKDTNASTSLLFTYTPMHGVGLPFAQRALTSFGFPSSSLSIVSAQSSPNPDFPTVKFPNPEELGALDLAIRHADEVGSTLVLANDPDADRFTAAEKQRDSGEWKQFTGDELGALLGAWALERYKEGLPEGQEGVEKAAMCASTVSSKMLRSMAQKEGFVFRETLTGFKWIGNEMQTLEDEGFHPIFAYEEAIGFMHGHEIKDKDGVTALALFAEMAASLARLQKPLTTHLDSLYYEYGFHATSNSYFICRDPKKTDRIFSKLRYGRDDVDIASPPPLASFRLTPGTATATLGPYPLTYLRDLTIGFDSSTADGAPTLPTDKSAHMVSFRVGSTDKEKEQKDGIEVEGTVRTSGTEPKIKFYLEARGPNTQRAHVREKLEKVRAAIGESWLRWEEEGLEKPLLPLEKKKMLRKRDRSGSSNSIPHSRLKLDAPQSHSDSLPSPYKPNFTSSSTSSPPLALPQPAPLALLDIDDPLHQFPLPPLNSSTMETDAFSTLQQPGYPQYAPPGGVSAGGAGAGQGAAGGTAGGAGLASPPMVPLVVEGGAYQPQQQYPPAMHHDVPLSPASAFGTPALSSSTPMSLASSHDTFSTLATPATGFGSSPPPAGGVYLAPSSPQPSTSAGYYAAGVGPEGSGLGLQQPQEPKQIDVKSVAAAAHAATQGAGGHRRTTSTVKPPEVSRKGEDLGLTLGDFDMLDTLGTGTFGRVLLARLRPDPHKRPTQSQPHYFAMKVLEKNTIVRLRQVEHVNSERATLAWVRHPFVVNLFCTFQDESNLYLLLEYVQGGELFSHLRRAGRFSADVARFYAANLVLALENLHRQDIIYRDLKPENLLIDHTGHIKMTDFGFAKYVPERTYTLCGTPEYLAPEIITATGHSAACDWWALGVLLFELLAGYPPFFADNPLEIYEKILQGRFGVPAHIDPLAKDLIRRLLTADLSKRLGNLKGGAQDVKNHPWFEGVDWSAVERKEIRAPIIPHTSIPGDCSNFERFPQTSIETMPGVLRALSKRKYGFEPERGEDPYGYLFPSF